MHSQGSASISRNPKTALHATPRHPLLLHGKFHQSDNSKAPENMESQPPTLSKKQTIKLITY